MSRLHAEIIVDQMVSQDPGTSTGFDSHVRVVDRSKFGTYLNKELGEKGRVLRNQEGEVKDGDTVTFGTGSSTFRFCYVPLVMFIYSRKGARRNNWIQEAMISIGACTTRNWSPQCTHVIVDESSPVTADLIEAVVTKKSIILSEWLKEFAAKNISTELPTCTSFLPTLSLGGTMVKIVEPKVREKCLQGYTFVLGSLDKYAFGDKFHSLLEAVNAKLLRVEEFCSNSQNSADGEDTNFVLVIPGESQNEFNHIGELASLSRVIDMKIVAAILTGNLDSSIIEPPSIVVSSSHSTDETVVADSDVEVDPVTSNLVAATDTCPDAIKYSREEKITIESDHGDDSNKVVVESDHGNDPKKYGKNKSDTAYSKVSIDKTTVIGITEVEVVAMKRLEKGDESVTDRHENSDIIFSQDLIVRGTRTPAPVRSALKNVVDFKCFKKREAESGNSFTSLIPFSKDTYRESDGGNNEAAQYIKEEKKRKQLEAIAEDLFNSEKGRKRASSGASIQSLFSRR